MKAENRPLIDNGVNPFQQKKSDAWLTVAVLRSGALAFGLLICAIVILFALYQQYQEQRLLETEGETVIGQVVGKRIFEDSEDGNKYYVTYSYMVDNVRREKEQKVDSSYYQNAATGNEIPILYAPSKPHVSSIEGQTSDAQSNFMLGMLVTLCIAGPLVGGIIFSMYRRAADADQVAELAATGQLVDGMVLEVKHWYDDEDEQHYTELRYRFSAPDTGQVIVTTKKFDERYIVRWNLPKRGNALKIMYSSPHNHRIL